MRKSLSSTATLSSTAWNAPHVRHKLEDVRLLAPIIPRSKVIGVGRNFAEHARELGNEVPQQPLLFLKPNTSVVGPNDPIVLPEFSDEVSYEAELCVVIGRICKDVPEERADDVIFGYTCGNDLTARDVQKTDLQWARAKGFDTSAPLGPWIETELDPEDLSIKGWLNGELRQDGSTNQMIRGVRELVSIVSSAFTLLPGDVIMTGTPAGVDLVQAGDRYRSRNRGHRQALEPDSPPLAPFRQHRRTAATWIRVAAVLFRGCSQPGSCDEFPWEAGGKVGVTMTTPSAPNAVSSSAPLEMTVKSPPTPPSGSGSAPRPPAPRTSA